jgi:hypothetical protein
VNGVCDLDHFLIFHFFLLYNGEGVKGEEKADYGTNWNKIY